MSTNLKTSERLARILSELYCNLQSASKGCLSTNGFSPKDLTIIEYVAENGDLMMKDIADHVGVALSTATGIVDRLVQKDILLRQHCDHDRRIVKLSLSTAGRQVYELCKDQKCGRCRDLLSALNVREQEQLIGLLDKIAARLPSSNGSPQYHKTG